MIDNFVTDDGRIAARNEPLVSSDGRRRDDDVSSRGTSTDIRSAISQAGHPRRLLVAGAAAGHLRRPARSGISETRRSYRSITPRRRARDIFPVPAIAVHGRRGTPMVVQTIRPEGLAFRTRINPSVFVSDDCDGSCEQPFSEIHHYRVPEHLPEGELPATRPPQGQLPSPRPMAIPPSRRGRGLVNLLNSLAAASSRWVRLTRIRAWTRRAVPDDGVHRDDRPSPLTDERFREAFLGRRRVVATNAPPSTSGSHRSTRGVMGRRSTTRSSVLAAPPPRRPRGGEHAGGS